MIWGSSANPLMRMGQAGATAIRYQARGDANADRDRLPAIGKEANAMLKWLYRAGGAAQGMGQARVSPRA